MSSKTGPAREPRLPWPATHITNVSELARQTGVHRTQWQRWKRDGIPLSAARRVAGLLGTTPDALWGNWTSQEAAA